MPTRRWQAVRVTESAYTVLWTEQAARDVEDVARWIGRDDPVMARNVLTRLRKRAATLRAHPTRGRPVPELERAGLTTWRELMETPWRIIYRIEDDRVIVLAVFDDRRDIEDVLFHRLTRR